MTFSINKYREEFYVCLNHHRISKPFQNLEKAVKDYLENEENYEYHQSFCSIVNYNKGEILIPNLKEYKHFLETNKQNNNFPKEVLKIHFQEKNKIDDENFEIRTNKRSQTINDALDDAIEAFSLMRKFNDPSIGKSEKEMLKRHIEAKVYNQKFNNENADFSKGLQLIKNKEMINLKTEEKSLLRLIKS